MTIHKTIACLALLVFTAGMGKSVEGQVGGSVLGGNFSISDDGRETRVLNESSGARADNNGGFTQDPLIIGDNGAAIPNYSIYGFDLSPFSGQIAVGDATIAIFKRDAQDDVAGSVDDIINVSELALINSNWVEGTGEITLADTPADDGSATYLNRAQFSGSGISEPWQDASGNAVNDLLGAITLVASRSGYASSDPFGTRYKITVPQSTAQRWLDDGLAGLVFSANDPDSINGDGFSRFAIADTVTIDFQAASVPEPGSGLLLAGLALAALCSRRRK